MKIKNIVFPTLLEEIEDITNDNIDVFIELEDGNTYTIVFATPLNILHLMEKNNRDYLEAAPPMIIVKELTHGAIDSAILSFCEGDAYWLKEYYLSGSFNITLLDKMVNELKKE